MQRDTRAPTVVSRPYCQRRQPNQHRDTRHGMRTHHSEVDQCDHRGKGQPIADDGESPGIAGISCEDQTADRTALTKGPPREQSPLAAVRAALTQSAPQRRADHCRAGRCHDSSLLTTAHPVVRRSSGATSIDGALTRPVCGPTPDRAARRHRDRGESKWRPIPPDSTVYTLNDRLVVEVRCERSSTAAR